MQSLSSLPPYAMDFNAIMIETKFGFPDYHPCPPKRERIRERFRHVHFPDCNFCFSFGLVWFCLSLRWCMLFPLPMRRMRYSCGITCFMLRYCMYTYSYLSCRYVLVCILHGRVCCRDKVGLSWATSRQT